MRNTMLITRARLRLGDTPGACGSVTPDCMVSVDTTATPLFIDEHFAALFNDEHAAVQDGVNRRTVLENISQEAARGNAVRASGMERLAS